MSNLFKILIIFFLSFSVYIIKAQTESESSAAPSFSNYDKARKNFYTIWGDDSKAVIKYEVEKDSSVSATKNDGYGFSSDMLDGLKTNSFLTSFDYKYTQNKDVSVKVDTSKNPFARSAFCIGALAGLSGFTMDTDFGETSRKFGYGFMVDYLYYFNQFWGMNVGIGISMSKSNFSGDGFKDRYSFVDVEGDRLDYSIKVDNISEDYKMSLLEIPLRASYNREFLNKGELLINAGVKLAVPLNIKYNQKMTGVDISCFNSTLESDMSAPVIGCVQDGTLTSKGKYSSTPIMVMLSGEFGYKIPLVSGNFVGVSLFVDYALNQMQLRAKNDKDNFQFSSGVSIYDLVMIDHEGRKSPNAVKEENKGYFVPYTIQNASVLSSKQVSTGSRIVDHFGYVNFGIKLSYIFGAEKK